MGIYMRMLNKKGAEERDWILLLTAEGQQVQVWK